MNDTRNNSHVRQVEVEALTNAADLAAVACTDESARVRMLAVSRIEDDQQLLSIVKKAKHLDVRLIAVERISSEELVAEVVKARENFELIGMCFSRITDRRIIEAIAEDTSCNPIVRRLAVEYFANEAYLAEVYEAKTGRKSEGAIDAFVDWYGGGLQGVRAIGRFKGSPKALMALGTIAQKGGEAGGLAVEYLCNALGSSNPKQAQIAEDELASLTDPEMVTTVVLAAADTKLVEPIRAVLTRIDTREARAALGDIENG